MDKVFILVSDADPRILTDVVFPYARNAIREHWMEEVVLILWGPIQRTVVSVLELKAEVMDLVETEKFLFGLVNNAVMITKFQKD